MEKRVCVICGKEFNPKKHNQKYCTKKCAGIARKEKRKEYDRKYNQSEKGKASIKRRRERYRNSEKGKKTEREYYLRKKDELTIYYAERDKKLIAELNSMYDGDLEDILEICPTSWREREAKMRVWFNESYADGVIAKIKSTPVCEVTGEKTNDLVIHHLYSFNIHPELGNDPANMVRISKEVHKAFHSIYGYGNNTPEQWIEFIEKQYGGD